MQRFFCGDSEYLAVFRSGSNVSFGRKIIFGYLFLPVFLTLLGVVFLVPEFSQFMLDTLGSIWMIMFIYSILSMSFGVIFLRMSLHFLFPAPSMDEDIY